MKTPISFCVALLLLLPLCRAQCGLNIADLQLVNALSGAGLISEADPSKFALQDLTYICFVRSSTDNTRFDQVRISMQYTYDSATVRSAQATFTLCLSDTFRYTSANTYTVTQDQHLTENTTREDCQDCLDNSTFARPTFCRLDDPCGAAPCANGGTCSRTGLTDFSCACVGPWSGPTCIDCSLACQNGGTRNEPTCTCNCAEGYGGVSCEACSRNCQNRGTLDPGACTCSCVGGFSGDNCETCPLTCQNGGTLNGAACTCSCADGYSGNDCETCSRTCQNGGSLNGTTCTDGFSGANCERGTEGGSTIIGESLGVGAIIGIILGVLLLFVIVLVVVIVIIVATVKHKTRG